MTGFVIGRIAALVFGHHHGAALRPHHDLVLGQFKVVHFHHATVAACGKKSGFVNEVGKIGTGEARRTACNHVGLHVGADRHLFHVHVENLFATADIGQRHHT